jgi:hypothetical protein
MPQAVSQGANPTAASNLALLLLPLAALVAILPLLIHGGSCGHDQVFHLHSWLDAAHQIRHGHYPRWAFSPAYNAGEPRFLFYPPLSWLLGAFLLGAALALHLPAVTAPILFTWVALTTAGFSFHRLARHFVSPYAALIASALYLANPYMLFNAFERTAYAELLAATWIPLLLLAVLRTRPTIRGIAIPVALLWLTNAPAAVMGCYTLALLATLRVLSTLLRPSPHAAASTGAERAGDAPASTPHLALTYIAGTALGLVLPSFYLVPVGYERRFVQVAMAISDARFQDNFLFARTADAAHDAVNHTASSLALTLLLVTVAAVSALLLRTRPSSLPAKATLPGRTSSTRFLPPTLAALTLVIALLLVPLSTPLWLHLPELAFLQFPWRLLTILSALLCLALALLFNPLGGPFMTRLHRVSGVAIATILPLALGTLCYHLYAQGCDPADLPSTVANLFRTHHGTPPTDEYTPSDADNNILRPDNPGFWLIPARDSQGNPANPDTPAPNTTPTPAELTPSITDDDFLFPDSQTLSTPAPARFWVHPAQPSILVLNLRDYPNWDVTGTGEDTMETEHYPGPQRNDGLIAMQLPPGRRRIDITWRRSPDQTLGLALSGCALIALALTFRSPRIL